MKLTYTHTNDDGVCYIVIWFWTNLSIIVDSECTNITKLVLAKCNFFRYVDGIYAPPKYMHWLVQTQ
jgi:hypothetical protein